MANPWTKDEVSASVDGYLEMLDAELNGRHYVKSKVNARLREGPLSARSKASVEYRMQNISAVLDELGLTRIKGYVPAKNVGTTVKKEILSVLKEKEYFD